MGMGWAWDDLVEGYGAAPAALQYAKAKWRSPSARGMTPGAPAVLYLSPSNHGLLVDSRAVTAAAGGEPSLDVAREPGTRFLDVTGRTPLGGAPGSSIARRGQPDVFFADGTAGDVVQRTASWWTAPPPTSTI